jgi:hypothetical protein
MKSKLPLLFFMYFLALGCSKDNNGAAPSISMKSYTDHVSNGNSFGATLSYSQKNGTLAEDSLIIIRRWYNHTPFPPGVAVIDTFLTFMPDMPNTSSAEFNVNIAYENLYVDLGGEADTIDLRFVLTDYNGNHSDTATTGKIVILP